MAKTIIINEFLTFVQNKIDKLDNLSIIQICATNFSENDIENGKSELFNALPESGRCLQRKGEDKSKKNIMDVLKVFKETEPSKQPIFVAQDLNKLPPVTFDHIDVTRLLKDLAYMKNEIESIRIDTISKSEMSLFETKIRSDLKDLQSSFCTKKSPKGKGRKSDCSAGAFTDDTSRHPGVPAQSGRAHTQAARTHASPSKQVSPPATAAEPLLPLEPVRTPSYRDIAMTNMTTSQASQSQANSNRKSTHNDSFILVERKKKRAKIKTNMIGTAQKSTMLQVIDELSAVYVSRLRKSITTDNIKEYIRDMGQDCKEVELLQQNRDTDFNSFKITILREKQDVFLGTEFWPSGVKYRLFRGRVSSGPNVATLPTHG